MTKRLYVMQGVPGSGKSTMADMLRRSYVEREVSVSVFSADDWRYKDGVYDFSPETSKTCHQNCQKAVIAAMQVGTEVIIVDNTNVTKWQAEPYLVMARIFDYEIQVVRVETPVEIAIARQEKRSEDRRVPEHVIRSMHEQMERLL